jgi:anti-anti-sigma factor
MNPSAILDFASTAEPDGTVVLHVRGEVDMANADQLRERLLAEFARHPRLVLDLSQAMFYDGAALRALQAVHRAAARQRRLPPTLRGVRPLLAKALKATDMHTLFPREAHPPFPLARTARPRPAALSRAA